MVVSNILYFYPYLGKVSNLTNIIYNIFQMGWFNHQLGNRHPKKISARLDSSSPAPVAPLQQMFIPPLAPVLPALPLLPIDDLLLSAGQLLIPADVFLEVFDVFCLHFPCPKSEVIGSLNRYHLFCAFWDTWVGQSSKCDGARSVDICQFGWALARGFNRLWLTYTPENLSWNNGGLEYGIPFSK